MRAALRVVLVDGHSLFRACLALWLSRHGITSIGEAPDARAAWRLLEREAPDVVISELHLPGSDGIVFARELLRRDKSQQILLLTMRADERFAALALNTGVRGYALKADEPGELLRALDSIAAGGRYVAPGLELETTRLITDGNMELESSVIGDLSPREREVFALLARGFGARAVAAELCISIKTVDTHRTRIMRKLRVRSTTALVLFAIEHDLACDASARRRP